MDSPKKKNAKEETVTNNNELIEDKEAFVERFEKLYNNKYLSDVTLCVNGDRYYAHKFILITVSEVFEAMLQNTWQESCQNEVNLSEEDACRDVFGLFLKYLYCGSVELNTDTTLPVLLLADKYSVKTLQKSCVNYMLTHIVASPDTNRTLTWYQYAKMTGQNELVEKCQKFILSNFNVILDTQDWTSLTKAEIIELLNSSDMIVKSEMDLWLHVESWLVTDSNKDTLAVNLKEILPLVRFHMILPKNLLLIESSELCHDYPELFKERLNSAYRHHSLSVDCEEMIKSNEPYRNYYGDEYKICYPFKLKDYRSTPRIDSKISVKCQVPLRFVSPSHHMSDNQSIPFQVYFYPQGFFSVITLYGSYIGRRTDKTSLRVLHRSPIEVPTKVHVTLVLYSLKNSFKYISFTHTSEHLLTKDHNFESKIENVIDVDHFGENSPYLIDGDLEGKIFIKIEDVGDHLVKPAEK
ncbi:hypothetical protein SNE40_005626 [Patella caerulea]|uniref:BTB domain-containing protein n=1 Tax=Patella caerulea TaxID=87958 RepID=A0AAN8PWQ8_PATCE